MFPRLLSLVVVILFSLQMITPMATATPAGGYGAGSLATLTPEVLANAFENENPYGGLRQFEPTLFDKIWGNGFLRVVVFGLIIALLKVAFGYTVKPSTPPPSKSPASLPPSQPAAPQLPSTPPTSPAAPIPPQSAPATITTAAGQWFYQSDEQEIGPFDENSLHQIRKAGVIRPSTRIRRADGGSWINYSDVFGQ